jgi:hypothetical protein
MPRPLNPGLRRASLFVLAFAACTGPDAPDEGGVDQLAGAQLVMPTTDEFCSLAACGLNDPTVGDNRIFTELNVRPDSTPYIVHPVLGPNKNRRVWFRRAYSPVPLVGTNPGTQEVERLVVDGDALKVQVAGQVVLPLADRINGLRIQLQHASGDVYELLLAGRGDTSAWTTPTAEVPTYLFFFRRLPLEEIRALPDVASQGVPSPAPSAGPSPIAARFAVTAPRTVPLEGISGGGTAGGTPSEPPADGTATIPPETDFREERKICRGGLDDRVVPSHFALAFTGDHFTADKRVDLQSAELFNLACAGTAPAKLHWMGHTEASSRWMNPGAPRPLTARGDATAALKMLAADFCGTGDSHTTSGQPLLYRDYRPGRHYDGHVGRPGFQELDISDPEQVHSIEAVWGPTGAVCLDQPRGSRDRASLACAATLPTCATLTNWLGTSSYTEHVKAYARANGGIISVHPRKREARIAAFRPTVAGFRFASPPDLDGGTALAALDYYLAGLAPPAQTTTPAAGPLLAHIASRQAWLKRHIERQLGSLAVLSRAEVLRDTLGDIQATLDRGELFTLGLAVEVGGAITPTAHTLVAWGYDRLGAMSRIYVYDPQRPGRDYLPLVVTLGGGDQVDITYPGVKVVGMFELPHVPERPFGLTDGMVVRVRNANVLASQAYAIVGGARFPVDDADLRSGLFGAQGIQAVLPNVLAQLAEIPRDGTVLRDAHTPEVKVMVGGVAIRISSPDELAAHFGGWSAVRLVPRGGLTMLDAANPRVRPGTIFRRNGTPEVYLVANGERHHITHGSALVARLAGWASVLLVPSEIRVAPNDPALSDPFNTMPDAKTKIE